MSVSVTSLWRQDVVTGTRDPAAVNAYKSQGAYAKAIEYHTQEHEGRQTAKPSKVGLSYHRRQGSSPHSRQA
jgi:hypothetical protein